MERAARAILNDALSLPEADRADIAGALLESIEPSTDADVEAAWRLEVSSRIAVLDAGEVATVAWEEVRDQLYARLRPTRGSG